MNPLLTTDEVARLIRRTPKTLREMVRAGRFPKPRLRGVPCAWTVEQVREWMNQDPEEEADHAL